MTSVPLFSVLLAVALLAGHQDPVVVPPQPFDAWMGELVADARERGFSDDLLQRTLAGLEPLPRVVQEDRTQAELVVGFERYYRSRVNARTVLRGREQA